jgi:hypothetical protein
MNPSQAQSQDCCIRLRSSALSYCNEAAVPSGAHKRTQRVEVGRECHSRWGGQNLCFEPIEAVEARTSVSEAFFLARTLHPNKSLSCTSLRPDLWSRIAAGFLAIPSHANPPSPSHRGHICRLRTLLILPSVRPSPCHAPTRRSVSKDCPCKFRSSHRAHRVHRPCPTTPTRAPKSSLAGLLLPSSSAHQPHHRLDRIATHRPNRQDTGYQAAPERFSPSAPIRCPGKDSLYNNRPHPPYAPTRPCLVHSLSATLPGPAPDTRRHFKRILVQAQHGLSRSIAPSCSHVPAQPLPTQHGTIR